MKIKKIIIFFIKLNLLNPQKYNDIFTFLNNALIKEVFFVSWIMMNLDVIAGYCTSAFNLILPKK